MKKNIIIALVILALGLIILGTSLYTVIRQLPENAVDPTDPVVSAKPESTDPQPTASQSTEPRPTETKPTEPKPTETQPTDPKPTETQPTEPKPTETHPPEPKPTETQPTEPKPTEPKPTETQPSSDISQEGDKLEQILQPGQIVLLRPEASGILTAANDYAIIDYSNSRDGYVMIKYVEETTKRLKVRIVGPTTTYTYNITVNEWTVFPLSDGNGDYQIKVLRNKEGNTYGNMLTTTINVTLDDEFAPFLRPNQYVNYENATQTMDKAAMLVAGITDPLDKVEVIFNFVVNNLTYDYEKAATVQSGYLPALDQVLEAKKGICFDYAALMAAMLRSQGIPCKLVVGFAGDVYHAWISVWSPDQGWVEGAIYFDGANWQLMDPTFASTTGNPAITGVTYTYKYIY